jgi:hypothetical protein
MGTIATKQILGNQGMPLTGHTPLSVPNGAEDVPSSDPSSFSRPQARKRNSQVFHLPWEAERAGVVHRFCVAVEGRRARGQSLREAIGHSALIRRGGNYRTEPRVKIHFSRGRLRSVYYHWLKNGKTPQSLKLRYMGRIALVSPGLVQRFVAACAAPGISSMSKAAHLVKLRNIRTSRILSAMPERLRREIKKTFRARRSAAFEVRQAARRLKAEMRKLAVADATRGRRLEKLAKAIA